MHNSRSFSYVPRGIEDRFLEASRQFPVLLLTGPRQVGKTTMLEALAGADRRVVTLDDMDLRALAREEPRLFLQRYPPPVLIDEIQYAPELLPTIKIFVDRHQRPGDFWLTGSQQFRLMRGITESLAGRVALVNLLGFSARERDSRRSRLPPFLPTSDSISLRVPDAAPTDLSSIYARIVEGSFPALQTRRVTDRGLFYRSYVATYIERDVRDLVNVGDLEIFRRFVRACAARTAQILNYTDLARDVGISLNTARKWLSVLVAGFQVYLLPPYHSNLTKRLTRRPKLYFLDTGICCHLTGWSSAETLERGAMSGPLLETYVFIELLKSWWHRLREPEIAYYRDKDRREVDFVIVQDGELYPIEVKKSARVPSGRRDLFRPLDRLGLPVAKGALACFYPEMLPINERTIAVPIGLI